MKIGITGQAGFVGTHLFNYLSLDKTNIQMIPFKDEYFSNKEILINWVLQCDVIIHLAALNRHSDPQVIYETNITLVKQLIEALKKAGNHPHILFSSSIQEERENSYGKSKQEGRLLLSQWAQQTNACFTGMVLPNVFGSFGRPYYNSVIATFSHQLTHNEIPRLETDSNLQLIYIEELVAKIKGLIINHISSEEYFVPPTAEKKVSEILALLERYKDEYFEKGIFPKIRTPFELNLFNTFRCYIDQQKMFPFPLEKHEDNRGSFVETIKTGIGGQISFSTTKPGITRGNHFHTRKIERFAVIKGEALIQLRRIGTDDIIEFKLSGDKPSFVDMPIWYTHNITNIGSDELYTIFWINEWFNSSDQDTFFEEV